MKFFVQCEHPDGSVTCELCTARQVIEMIGYRSLTGCEYKVYDVSRFGEVEMLTYVTDSANHESNFHSFNNERGDSLICGYFPEG